MGDTDSASSSSSTSKFVCASRVPSTDIPLFSDNEVASCPQLIDFYEKCVSRDPKQRMDCQTLLKHPLFELEMGTYEELQKMLEDSALADFF